VNLRTGAYSAENAASLVRGKDRKRDKPTSLRTLLRWLVREYALEAPAKLHTGSALEEDGDPAMTGESKAWLGMSQGNADPKVDSRPNDWLAVACRTDADGFYVSPLRCAIARIHSPERRNLVGELAVNLLFPRDVMDAHDIPAWAQNDVAYASLSIVWDTYADRPLPRSSVGWVEKSDAQRAAEDAA
jgi:hypothetical protein